MAQPWWNQHGLGAKIKFALNANYSAAPDSYGESAAQAAPAAAFYLGHANYVGPKWETGEEPFETFDGHGMQETTVGAYVGMFPLIAQIAATRAQLAGQGLASYRPIAYEGGPSGYCIPRDPDCSPEQVANSELYGKSLGMAVSALDAWLYSSLHGFAHQTYYAYYGGTRWTSHTMPGAGGFRRHASWLALTLRNRFAQGGTMVETTVDSAPAYEREGADVPLISAYALRGPDSWSVFVLSRKVDGVHDGIDFGAGMTPVTIHLPFTRCASVTRYALAAPDGAPADPRVNNIDAERVVISQFTVDPAECDGGVLVIGPDTGGAVDGLPPGTIYLYVFEENAPRTPTPGPTPTALPAGLGVSLEMPGTYFVPGAACGLTCYLRNDAAPLQDVPLFVVLDVASNYWFWPGWTQDVHGTAIGTVPSGTTTVPIVPEFTWPAVSESLDGIVFWGAMLTGGQTAVRGDYGQWTFGYGPALPVPDAGEDDLGAL